MVFLGCLAVVMLVLGKGIFGNVRMLFLLYARIGVINVAKCLIYISRCTIIVLINKPKKTLCLQYDKPSVGVCKHNAIIKGCKFGRFLKFHGVWGI